MVRWLGVAMAAWALLASAAAADPFWRYNLPAYGDARRALESMPEPARESEAHARCAQAIGAHEGASVGPWCLFAYEALNARTRGRALSTERDIAIAEHAAWVEMLEGAWLRSGSAVSRFRTLMRRAPPSDAAVRARVFPMLSTARRGETIENDVLERVAEALAEPPLRGGSFPDQRLELMQRIADSPRTPARLWAAAAMAQMFIYFPGDASRETVAAHAALLAPLVARIAPDAQGLSGLDSALDPLLARALGAMLEAQRDIEGALAVREAAAGRCAAALWSGAELCGELGARVAADKFTRARLAEDPAYFTRPRARRLSDAYYSAQMVGVPCRAIYVVDIDELGMVRRSRLLFSDPPNVCEHIAGNYLAALRYTPADPANPEERRADLLVAFMQRPE